MMVIVYVSLLDINAWLPCLSWGTFAFSLHCHGQHHLQEKEEAAERGYTLLHRRLRSLVFNRVASKSIIEEPVTSYNNEEEEEASSLTTLHMDSPFLSLEVSLISSISELSPSHLINPNRIYKLINNKGVIIHSSQLNLPYTPSSNHHKSSTHNNWLLIQSPYPPTQTQVHFPISKCHNQQFGDGGSIDVQSTIFASFINTLDLTLGLNILFASESFTARFELTKSITWRNLYTCTVPDGMIGQIWARSDVVVFDGVELSFIEFEGEETEEEEQENNGITASKAKYRPKLRHKQPRSRSKLRSKLKTKKHKLKLKFWRKLQKIKMFNGGGGKGGLQRRPIISCVTDVRLLDCSGKRTRDSLDLEVI